MSTFKLEVMTPEKKFLEAEVEALTVDCVGGQITVLKGHAPLVAALEIGDMKIKIDGSWKHAFNSEGFLEVRPDEVLVFIQACEWPENIDAKRAEEALARSQEKLRQKQSILEHKHNQISLTRAMVRLRVTKTKID